MLESASSFTGALTKCLDSDEPIQVLRQDEYAVRSELSGFADFSCANINTADGFTCVWLLEGSYRTGLVNSQDGMVLNAQNRIYDLQNLDFNFSGLMHSTLIGNTLITSDVEEDERREEKFDSVILWDVHEGGQLERLFHLKAKRDQSTFHGETFRKHGLRRLGNRDLEQFFLGVKTVQLDKSSWR